MITDGSIVSWHPANISAILPEEAAAAIGPMLPLHGTMLRVDGAIGIMKYRNKAGVPAEITVKLDECTEARLVK